MFYTDEELKELGYSIKEIKEIQNNKRIFLEMISNIYIDLHKSIREASKNIIEDEEIRNYRVAKLTRDHFAEAMLYMVIEAAKMKGYDPKICYLKDLSTDDIPGKSDNHEQDSHNFKETKKKGCKTCRDTSSPKKK